MLRSLLMPNSHEGFVHPFHIDDLIDRMASNKGVLGNPKEKLRFVVDVTDAQVWLDDHPALCGLVNPGEQLGCGEKLG